MDDDDNSIAEIWRNNSGVFEQDTDQELVGLRYVAAVWGDINKDGLIDLIMTGMDEFGEPQTILYTNSRAEGVNRFKLIHNTTQSFLNVSKGSLALGDFENDGDLDLVITGIDASGFPNAALYINDPVGFFSVDNENSQNLLKLSSGSLNWTDYDSDGYLDLLQTGLDAYWEAHIAILENEHNARLGDDVLDGAFSGVAGVAISANFDNDDDGDFDIAILGKDHFTNLYGTILQHQSNNTYS
ncbi:hypothetical protein ACFL6I_29180, partial [candidate division KSB1 bacterium]